MAGKPKKPEEVKTYMLRVRMTEAEHALLEDASKALSLGVSSWARSELVKLARKILGAK
jgi:hypothetical protein